MAEKDTYSTVVDGRSCIA